MLIAIAEPRMSFPEAVPVTAPVNGPAKPVAVNTPVLELNVRFVPLLGGRPPVAAVTNNGKQVVSLDSSATVTFVAVVAVVAVPDVSWFPAVFTPARLIFAVPSNETPPIVLAVSSAVAVLALPVTAPVIGPANPVVVSIPVLELNVRFVPLLGGNPPVAAVTNKGKQVVSLDSSATVTLVAVVAVPDVSWFPVVFTPGKLIFAVPLNETPPIVLAVSRAVAVSALPVTSPVSGPANAVAVAVPFTSNVVEGVTVFIPTLLF